MKTSTIVKCGVALIIVAAIGQMGLGRLWFAPFSDLCIATTARMLRAIVGSGVWEEVAGIEQEAYLC
jgi:hypothetical protein